MKETLALIIAIIKIIVTIVLIYWFIRYAVSAIEFFNDGCDFFKSVSTTAPTAMATNILPHLW